MQKRSSSRRTVTYAISGRLGRHDVIGERSHTKLGTLHGNTAASNSVGHRTLDADYYITSHARSDCCTGMAFPASRRTDPVSPCRISIGDNVGETSRMERTESSPGGSGACHDDVCGPDGSCCSRATAVTSLTATRRGE